MSTDQIQAFRTIIEDGFSRGNLDALDDIVASDMVEHQQGAHSGLGGLKSLIRGLREGFPDLQLTVEDITSDGDKVWGRLKGRGTHEGPFMGMPPTGKRIEIDIIDICRFEGGKMVEHWGVADRLAQLTQLGVLSRPGETPARGRA